MNKKELKNIENKVNIAEDITPLTKAYKNSFENDTQNYGSMSGSVLSWLQKLSARKLWAKRPLFSLSNKRQEKVWNKQFDNQRVLDILFNMERKLVSEGKCYLVVEPGLNNIPVIRIATTGNHIKYAGKLVKANIFTTILNGEYTYNINELYTIGNVKRSITREGVDIDGAEKVSIDRFRSEVGIKLKENETFTYEIPVVVVENIPTESGNGEGDLDSLGPQLISLQKIWNRIQWELDVNRTFIFTNDTSFGGASVSAASEAAYNKMVQQNIVVEKSGINAPGESNTTLSVAQLQLDQTWKAFGNTLGMIFEICGYKRNSDDKGTVQQNDLEIQQVRDSEITTFTMKERTRQTALKELINIYFSVAQDNEKEMSDVSVDIQYMNVKNETAMLDNLEKAINLKLISQVDAVAQYRNVTTKDAIKLIDEIKTETEDNKDLFENQLEDVKQPNTAPVENEGGNNE